MKELISEDHRRLNNTYQGQLPKQKKKEISAGYFWLKNVGRYSTI
jgi:hypothetical protein